MATIVTLAQDNPPLLPASHPQECAYCRGPILSGERWVREKIYEPLPDPRYHRYHADLSPGEELSCWEKHQLEHEIAQPAA
jgi:hypothetical protein